MRLRTKVTVRKLASRRTRRLALILAIIGGSTSSLAAQSALPSFPTHESAAAESVLLPYPFGSRAAVLEQSRTQLSRSLVRLLGLNKSTARPPTGPSWASSLGSPAMPELEAPTEAAGPLVALASATEESVCTVGDGAQPVATQCLASTPECNPLPSYVGHECNPEEQLVVTAEAIVEESLIIEIPLSLDEPGSHLLGESGHHSQQRTPQIVTPKPSLKLNAEPRRLASAQTQLPALSVPALNMPGSGMPETAPVKEALPTDFSLNLNDRESAKSADGDSVERNVSSTTNLSDRAEAQSEPVLQAEEFAITSSLTDTEAVDAPEQNTAAASLAPSREATLHRSSASSAPIQAMPLQPTAGISKPIMQVRIEGEPAPLVPATYSSEEQPPQTSFAITGDRPAKTVRANFATQKTPATPETVRPASVSGTPPELRMNGKLVVGLQGTVTVPSSNTVLETSVEDPSICQLLKTGNNGVAVVGIRTGMTRVAVVTEDESGKRHVDIHQVEVGNVSSAGLRLSQLAKDISNTIKRLYPQSDVSIVANDDTLLVRGFTAYESDAMKILSLVRKTSLAPVVDELKTTGQ